MKFFFGIVFFIFCSTLIVNSQIDTNNYIKYTSDFKFKEGVFLSFEHVKKNFPLEKSKIQNDIDVNNLEYFDKLFQSKSIIFLDEGKLTELPIEKIWGVSKNGTLYINRYGELYRIPFLGSISHFVATITTYRERFHDPFYYDPYYFSFPQQTFVSKEVRQFLLDFSTGQIYDYNLNNVSILLMKDSELFDEFNLLKKRKKKQLMFLYIRKFNEKNPLYFPLN